jgi:hypothetical protein
MLSGYALALPPSAALPPVGSPALVVDLHPFAAALLVALAIAGVVLVLRGRAAADRDRGASTVRGAGTSTARRAA